jgi:uncharacterized BrkB/YihY/UPF0761 family membrane protein
VTGEIHPDGGEPTGALGRATRALREAGARLEAARGGHPVVDALFQVVSRDKMVAGGLLASAVAFRLFLWIVPLAVVFVSAFGFYVEVDPGQAGELARDYGVTAFITGSVGEALAASDRGRWLALIGGLILLAWSSRSLAISLRAVHALAWGIRPVPPIEWSARAVLYVAGLMAGMVLVLPAVAWLRQRSPTFGIAGTIVAVFVVAAMWVLASVLLPRREVVRWTALLPGAVLVGTVLELLHLVSLVYLPGRFDRASSTYGSLGVAVVALAWLYFSGRAVGAGAVLNVTLWERRTAATARNGSATLRDDGRGTRSAREDDRP